MTAQIIPFIPQDAIIFSQEQVRTTSQKVAEAFGKQHKHVADKLRTIECSEQFLTANFSAVKFSHRGNEYDAWEMTKDGFMFLVMGFTGKKAARIKEAFINAFNAMAEQICSQANNLKTKTALPNGLTLDQCDAIKALVKARAESCPKEKQGAAATKCWSSLKSKFGCGYKEIPPEHFTEALSLVARIELEGEYLPKQELPPIDTAAALSIPGSNLPGLNLSDDIRKAISLKAYSLAHEAFELSIDHLTQRVAYEHGTSIKRGAANKDDVIATINAGTLGYALTYKMHDELERIVNQAAGLRYMATQLEEKIRGGSPQLSAP